MKLDRRYHCFGCGADGDVIDFAAALYGLGKKEAAVQLAQDFGLSYEDWKPPGKAKKPKPRQKSPEEHRPIGKYGRMHREYLREAHPARLNTLTLTGELWTYLADLNEQAQERLDTIMMQMKAADGVTEELKRTHQMEWVQRCNNIHNRAEEIILQEMIYS